MRHLYVSLLTLILLTRHVLSADAPPFKFIEEDCDRDFTVRAAVLVGKFAPSRSEARLAFNYQSDDNFYCVRVAGAAVELLKIQDGKSQPLKSTPFKTYADGSIVLTLKRRGAKMTLVVNGAIAARVDDDTFNGGKIGTSEVGIRFTDVRYQPTEPVFFGDDFTRAGRSSEWADLTSNWHLSNVKSNKFEPDAASNPFSLRSVGHGLSMTTAGRWFWDDYAFDAAVKAESDGCIGLVTFFQDGNNYVVFRWFSNGSNVPAAKQLIAVVNGQPRTLDAKPGGYEPGQWYKLTVKVSDAQILTFVDDEPANVAAHSYFGQGKIGLYTEFCRSALFDDIAVRPWTGSASLPVFSDEPKVSRQFTKEETMTNWASPAAEWIAENNNAAWHRGEFFGDASIAVRLVNLRTPGRLMLCLHSPAHDFHQGYTLQLQIVPTERSVLWELWRQGSTVAQGKQTWEEDLASLVVGFFRAGQQIIGYVASQRAFEFTDTTPLKGRNVGFYTLNVPVAFHNVQTNSTHLIDETFSDAPTRWWRGRGAWRVEPRWPCDEKWAWMTGGDAETPTLWSKSAFTGDLIVEAFAAVQMDANESSTGYKHPSDLNVTLCGDGKDLGSGYNFIFAGWHNTQSGILRQGKIVATNAAARIADPVRTNNDFHRHWYHIRIEKRGGWLRFFVDDQFVADYSDLQPLPNGRIAFWSYKNGIVLARVRVWYENTAPAPPFPTMARFNTNNANAAATVKIADVPNSIIHDFEGQLHGWNGQSRISGSLITLDNTTASRSRHSLRIQNPISGGDFLAWTVFHSMDVAQSPILRFDYKLPPTVKVNLIVRINGRYYTIVLTGGEQPRDPRPALTTLPNVIADNRWRTAEINLLNTLRSQFPNTPAFLLDGIAFSSPDETYLRCGIGGNYWGSAFNVDNFQMTPVAR
jgi:hypothetical protein